LGRLGEDRDLGRVTARFAALADLGVDLAIVDLPSADYPDLFDFLAQLVQGAGAARRRARRLRQPDLLRIRRLKPDKVLRAHAARAAGSAKASRRHRCSWRGRRSGGGGRRARRSWPSWPRSRPASQRWSSRRSPAGRSPCRPVLPEVFAALSPGIECSISGPTYSCRSRTRRIFGDLSRSARKPQTRLTPPLRRAPPGQQSGQPPGSSPAYSRSRVLMPPKNVTTPQTVNPALTAGAFSATSSWSPPDTFTGAFSASLTTTVLS
jgi:hypothetical protein